MTQFDQDVFISYAHQDSERLSVEDESWIVRFDHDLRNLLAAELGVNADDVRVWRDERKLAHNEQFSHSVLELLDKTRVLVAVIANRYLNSDWCRDELERFCAAAKSQGGLVVNDLARVFKIMKSPVEDGAQLPAEVSETLGYEFFKDVDGVDVVLDPQFPELKLAYVVAMKRLVRDLKKTIKLLTQQDLHEAGGSGTVATDASEPTKPVVFLGECSYDLREERALLEDELRRRGYKVLPTSKLPADEEAHRNAVRELLEQSQLAVHIVGGRHVPTLDGPRGVTPTIAQLEIAAEVAAAQPLTRLIWVPGAGEDDVQRAFLERLRTEAAYQTNADRLEGSVEQLKTSVFGALQRLGERKPPVSRDAGKKLVYVMCERQDREDRAVLPLRKFLREHGFQEQVPELTESAAAVSESTRRYLAECDAVILFYGAGSEEWKRATENELRQMPEYREGPLPPVFTYLAGPVTVDKKDLIDLEEPNLINGLEGIDGASFEQFLQALGA